MKIATFNVKSVVRRLPNLVAWLKSAKPDVVCLQELKADEAKLPREALEKPGYRGVWRGQKTCNGVLVGCLYLPNGNPQPRPKFDYKLAWFERLIKHARALKKSGAPVVLAGDFNVVPTDAEIYPTKSWDDDARLQPESRAAHKKAAATGLDGWPACNSSPCADVCVLGLQTSSLAPRCRLADRSPASQSRPCSPPCGGRR